MTGVISVVCFPGTDETCSLHINAVGQFFTFQGCLGPLKRRELSRLFSQFRADVSQQPPTGGLFLDGGDSLEIAFEGEYEEYPVEITLTNMETRIQSTASADVPLLRQFAEQLCDLVADNSALPAACLPVQFVL